MGPKVVQGFVNGVCAMKHPCTLFILCNIYIYIEAGIISHHIPLCPTKKPSWKIGAPISVVTPVERGFMGLAQRSFFVGFSTYWIIGLGKRKGTRVN